VVSSFAFGFLPVRSARDVDSSLRLKSQASGSRAESGLTAKPRLRADWSVMAAVAVFIFYAGAVDF
jgi:hypothetical protein